MSATSQSARSDDLWVIALTAQPSSLNHQTIFEIKGIDFGADPESSERMPRLRRNQEPGLIRHIMSRGNGRMEIFDDDGDYGFFLMLMGIVFQRFEIECWNYCLMPNHTHVLIQTSQPNLSDAMQQLNSAYAQWWNKRKGRIGHVFQGRFKSQIVEGGGYLLAVSRYIARNPARANLVRSPEDWRWSSYSATIGMEPVPAFLSVSPTLELFAPGDETERQARFKAFVCGDTDVATEQWIRSNERILGDHTFRARFRNNPTSPEASPILSQSDLNRIHF